MAPNSLDVKYHGSLALGSPHPEVVEVRLIPSRTSYEQAIHPDWRSSQVPSFEVVTFDHLEQRITIYPLHMYPKPGKPVSRKYDKLITIAFDGFPFELPVDEDDVTNKLSALPLHFFRQPEQGLGLPVVLKPIVKSIEALPNVKHLIIASDGQAELVGDTFRLPVDEFLRAAARLIRISDMHQRRSLQERTVQAYNLLVRPTDPLTYPEKRVPYDENTIFEILSVVDKTKVKLGASDRAAIAKELGKHAAEMHADDPEQLFQLQRQIELVSLDRLIDGFTRLLKANRSAETRWQKLFDLNPFILSMVFSHPIVVVMKEAVVGLPLITGAGQKVADFLVRNPGSANAALVEIKTPQEKLTGAVYRGGLGKNPVYGPAKGLVGAVAQVLDQRFRLQKDIAALISNNEDLKLKTYHVECIVVAGRLPTETDELKAFEIYRNSLKDVRVITFDELLAKIESLRDLLMSAPQADGLSEAELNEDAGRGELNSPDSIVEDEGDQDGQSWDGSDDLQDVLG